MENERFDGLTSFDELTYDRHLQMMKAAIPYMETGQKNMAMIVKYLELQRTLSIFESPESNLQMCSLPESSEPRSLQMLEAIRDYCTETEQENIDMMINFMQMFSAYETLLT